MREPEQGRPPAMTPYKDVGWQNDDWVALQVARFLFTGEAPPASLQNTPVIDCPRVLAWHKLLGHVGPHWDWLPLDPSERIQMGTYDRSLRLASLRRVSYACAIRDALQDAGIRAVFIKGVVLSQVVWGVPWARGAGDIDVLVPEDELEDAVRVLQTVGCRVPARIADLRPRKLDRALHHALSLQYQETAVDVHYRLDSYETVLALPFDRLYTRTREVLVAGAPLRTFDDELTLLVLAANGGRDLWARWGQVLDFATLNRRVDVDGRTAAELGVGLRLEVGQAMAELLSTSDRSELSPTAHRLARRALSWHAAGEPHGRAQFRRLVLEQRAWKVRSAPSARNVRNVLRGLVWAGDAAGRNPDDGIAEDVGVMVRRALKVNRRPVMEPPEHLADLVDGALLGQIDRVAFAQLERSMRADTLSSEDTAVLTLLGPLMAEQLPDHGFTGRALGLRRRARVKNALTEALLDSARQHAGDGLLTGGLGAARTFYQQPADRLATGSTLVVPWMSRGDAWRAARAAAGGGTVVDIARWPVLERHGVRLGIHRSLSIAFDFPRVRHAIDDSPEWVMYDSLVRSAQGAPMIQWYADAVHAQGLVDWNRVWEIAGIAGWYDPVAGACAVLRARLGWDVPLRLGMDRLVDSGYFSRSPVRPVRLSWLGLRMATSRLPRVAGTSTQLHR